MAEYFSNVIARLIISYLTLLVMSLAILAGFWIIEDYNAMIEFIKSISDNTFTHIVLWSPFVFSWFKSSSGGRTDTYYDSQVKFWEMYDTTGGRW